MKVDDAASEAAFVEQFERERTLAGSARLLPPTRTGPRSRWHSSTRPAAIALPARRGPANGDVAV